jgi:DNA-binding response OmpR family regulator
MKKVLLVTDETIPVHVMRPYLARMGYQIVEVLPDANAALVAVQFYRPELVIMNIDLPGPLDGVELMGRIRQFSAIPVIFTSPQADEPTRERATRIAHSCLMVKPLHQQLLLDYVNRFLGAGAPEGHLEAHYQVPATA